MFLYIIQICISLFLSNHFTVKQLLTIYAVLSCSVDVVSNFLLTGENMKQKVQPATKPMPSTYNIKLEFELECYDAVSCKVETEVCYFSS